MMPRSEVVAQYGRLTASGTALYVNINTYVNIMRGNKNATVT